MNLDRKNDSGCFGCHDGFDSLELSRILPKENSASSYGYPPSLNTSQNPTPDDKSVYKDCGTNPVEDEEDEKKDQEGDGDGGNNRRNADASRRGKRSIARTRAKVHKTVTLHERVVTQRVQMRELQSQVKQKREEELEQRVALMQAINTFCAHIEEQRDSKAIEARHEQLQVTTDEYLELERRCDVGENELQQRELDLDMAVEGLTVLLEEGSDIENGGPEEEEHMDYEGEEVDSYDAMSYTETMHPDMIEYLKRLGDVEIYRERLCDINQEYYRILEAQEVLQRVNVPLDEESQEFLDSYKEERADVEAKIEYAVSEAHRLEKQCEAEGLFDSNNSNSDNDNNANEVGTMDVDVQDDFGISEAIEHYQSQPTDPLKAEMDEHPHIFFEPQDCDDNIGHGTSASGKFDRGRFINKWLLHQLRHSSLEISRLKARPELKDPAMRGINDISISQQALNVWYIDDADMAEAPPSPSITQYPVYHENTEYAEYSEYAEVEDCDPTVIPMTAQGNESQGSAASNNSTKRTARNRSQSVPQPQPEPWVSAHNDRKRSCTIL